MKGKREIDSGVSVIVSTNRPHYFERMIANFMRQTYEPKELIVILNKDSMFLTKYQRKAAKYNASISVHQLPESTSLGYCLNYAINQARFPIISRFDDDDYYGARYLKSQLEGLKSSGADIVGKRACYAYLEASNKLILRYPKEQNCFVKQIAGATFVCRKKLFRKIKFLNCTLGETVGWLRRSLAKGYKIYSTDCDHYVIMRRKNKASHTWRISDQKLMSQSKGIDHKTKRFHAYLFR
ncbi:glycosyltransferase family A protein [Paenibacillus sp. RC67]|uniref:glycosyltransferase n=1 Tax=Paenibacillus sp. RC67 TaxID=3039392 RepID=UPI0024ADAE5D|nr:glycosyltransferase family A protein [Paenibacillus sp. RC67]